MNRKIDIGIGSYTYTWSIGVPGYVNKIAMSAFDLIEKAADLKADVVQFADNVPLDDCSPDELLRLYLFARERGVRLEVGAKGLTSDRLRLYTEIAGILHADLLRFVIDDVGFEPSPDRVIEMIRPAIPLMEERGVSLALENHDRLRCADLLAIIAGCNSSNVGICLDTVNSLGVPEGMDEVIRTLSPYTLNLHVKDFVIRRLDHKMGFCVNGASAGEGKLDIAGLFRNLTALGKCRSAILELWTPFGPTLEDTIARENEWAINSMNYLKQLSY